MQAKATAEQPSSTAPLQKGWLVRDEERAVGKVKRHHYRTYLSSWSPFYLLPSLMLTAFLAQQGFQVTSRGQNPGFIMFFV